MSCVLSGLNEEAHIEENVALASSSAPGMLGAADEAAIEEIGATYQRLMRVGCTGCSYCMPCPFGVDIPYAFSMLNAKHLFEDSRVRFQYSLFTSGFSGGNASAASLCRECGACEKKCPQHIPIRSMLKEADAELSMRSMKVAAWALGLIRRLRVGRSARNRAQG